MNNEAQRFLAKSYYKAVLEGNSTRFLPLVFSVNRTYLGPWFIFQNSFKFGFEFAKIFKFKAGHC
jgi:hypothetical protein